MKSVYCAVRTVPLNKAVCISSSSKILILPTLVATPLAPTRPLIPDVNVKQLLLPFVIRDVPDSTPPALRTPIPTYDVLSAFRQTLKFSRDRGLRTVNCGLAGEGSAPLATPTYSSRVGGRPVPEGKPAEVEAYF